MTKGRTVAGLPTWVMLPSLAWLIVFFVLPLIGVGVIAFGTPVGYGGVQLGFDLSSFQQILRPTYLSVFTQTLVLAAVGTIAVFVVAFPTAYWLARFGGKHRSLLLALLVIPFWISFLVRTFAWLIILSPDWYVSELAAATGLVDELRLVGTQTGVGLVIVYNYLPLGILPLYATLERMNWSLVEAAKDLGASSWGAFRQVTLPSILPGVVVSALLIFIPMTGEYIVPQIIGSGKTALYANLIGQQFLQAQNWPLGAAMATFLVVIVGATAVIVLTLTQRREVV